LAWKIFWKITAPTLSNKPEMMHFTLWWNGGFGLWAEKEKESTKMTSFWCIVKTILLLPYAYSFTTVIVSWLLTKLWQLFSLSHKCLIQIPNNTSFPFFTCVLHAQLKKKTSFNTLKCYKNGVKRIRKTTLAKCRTMVESWD